MPKRIVLFSDGTWKTSDYEPNGANRCTNVVKMARAVAPQSDDGVHQAVYYDKGLGTDRFDKYLGGLFGWGTSKNIQEAYRFLVDQFEPRDEIYLFGFSRGAYMVRSIAGLIRNCGILKREHTAMISDAYALYRQRDNASKPSAPKSKHFRQAYAHPDALCRIKCIGVWDTVGTLGIPFGDFEFGNPYLAFHNTTLGCHIDHAYHALAIDEKRKLFAPTLWQADPKRIANKAQTLEQVWFAGCHSDIGGGNGNPTLSNIALAWMQEKAVACGLAFTHRWSETSDTLGEIRESRVGGWTFLPQYTRRVQARAENGLVTNESIHPTVYTRIQRQENPVYRPANFPAHEYLARKWWSLPAPGGVELIGQGTW